MKIFSKHVRAYLYGLAMATAVLLAGLGVIDWYVVALVSPFLLALLNLKEDEVTPPNLPARHVRPD